MGEGMGEVGKEIGNGLAGIITHVFGGMAYVPHHRT